MSTRDMVFHTPRLDFQIFWGSRNLWVFCTTGWLFTVSVRVNNFDFEVAERFGEQMLWIKVSAFWKWNNRIQILFRQSYWTSSCLFIVASKTCGSCLAVHKRFVYWIWIVKTKTNCLVLTQVARISCVKSSCLVSSSNHAVVGTRIYWQMMKQNQLKSYFE